MIDTKAKGIRPQRRPHNQEEKNQMRRIIKVATIAATALTALIATGTAGQRQRQRH